jgi:hypothetical protein
MDAIIVLFMIQVIDFSISRAGDSVLLVGGVISRKDPEMGLRVG